MVDIEESGWDGVERVRVAQDTGNVVWRIEFPAWGQKIARSPLLRAVVSYPLGY